MTITINWVTVVFIIVSACIMLGFILYDYYWTIRNAIEGKMKKKKEEQK